MIAVKLLISCTSKKDLSSKCYTFRFLYSHFWKILNLLIPSVKRELIHSTFGQ